LVGLGFSAIDFADFIGFSNISIRECAYKTPIYSDSKISIFYEIIGFSYLFKTAVIDMQQMREFPVA